jgi:hypothetical protein
MQAVEIHDHARRLFETMGPKAIAEAARKACEFEAQGAKEAASDWRRIEAALASMSGPRAK